MFGDSSHKKCVAAHVNGVFDHGKVIYIEPEWTYLDLLSAGTSRLDIVPAARRVFNANGVELDDCIMIEDDDILFFSSGDDFQPPSVDSGDQYRIANGLEREMIPTVVGSYKVGKLLGRGAFGEVRVGEHQVTSERVALKFLRKSEILSIGAAERTITEIQCLTALRHQNIIRLQQHLEAPEHVILVFELMEGGDLKSYLHQRSIAMETSCALSEDEARMLFHQLVSGVSFAHNQHICHRDLKLENILLKGPSLSLVKIADFGLSAFYRPGALVKSSCGTLSFLAPEVFHGTANAGPPLDVWSLGVILFSLLCGRLPFEGNDLTGTKRPRDAIIKSRIIKGHYKIDENLGPEAKDLVRRMLKLDPSERASIPEILNHIWMRQSSNMHHLDNSMAISQTLFGSLYSLNAPTTQNSSAPSPINTPTALMNQGNAGFFKRDVRSTPIEGQDLGSNIDGNASDIYQERNRTLSVEFENSPSRRHVPHSKSEKLRMESVNELETSDSSTPASQLQRHRSWRLNSRGDAIADEKSSPYSASPALSGPLSSGSSVRDRDSVLSYNSPAQDANTLYGIGGGRSRRGTVDAITPSSPMLALSRENSGSTPTGAKQQQAAAGKGSWFQQQSGPGGSVIDFSGLEKSESPIVRNNSAWSSSSSSFHHSRALSHGSSGEFSEDKKDMDPDTPTAAIADKISTFKLEPLRRANIIIVDDDSDNDENSTTSMVVASHLGASNAMDSASSQSGQSSANRTNRQSRSPGMEISNAVAGSKGTANRPKTVTEGNRPRKDRDKGLDHLDTVIDDQIMPPIGSPYVNSSAGLRRGGRRGMSISSASGESTRDSPIGRDKEFDDMFSSGSSKVRDRATTTENFASSRGNDVLDKEFRDKRSSSTDFFGASTSAAAAGANSTGNGRRDPQRGFSGSKQSSSNYSSALLNNSNTISVSTGKSGNSSSTSVVTTPKARFGT